MVFAFPLAGKGEGTKARGWRQLLMLARTSVAAPTRPAKHVTSCSEGLLAPFQAPDIADGNSDTEAIAETKSQC